MITGRLSTALADRYQIERHLGEGGMANVYLARDLKHQRRVALKVLRPELAAVIGADRFFKEIEVTANLQHPNILALYDSGQADTFLYYVMPYVEGESLRTRLEREKQLGVESTVAIAKSVASALDYAHRRGVIHRDIKPENILLHDGQAMVADFGIALALSQAGGTRLTETGLSLGTPQYMSPEQATGDRALDARSDIYSLGAMTYEMLTGDPPHTGNTVQAIVARILTATPPPITQVRNLVPPNVEAAVQRALAKTPADRFATAADFAAALSNPSYGLTQTVVMPAAKAGPRPHWSSIVLGAALLITAVALAWSLTRDRAASTGQVVRVAVTLPDSRRLVTGFSASRPIDISPDGTRLLYTGLVDGRPMLIVRRLDALEANPVPGTEGATQPFFSADGQAIGFFAGGSLKKVSLAGGPPVTLASAANARGGTWLDDGHIVYAPASAGGLMRVSSAGGTPEVYTELDSASRRDGTSGYRWPAALPNGNGVVFTVFNGLLAESRIAVVSTPRGKVRNLVMGGSAPTYVPTGHLLFVNDDGALVGVRFDPSRPDTVGPPVTLAGGIAVDAATHAGYYAVSATGTLVYLQGSLIRSIVRVNRNGSQQVLLDSVVAPASLRFSPDGSHIAMEAQTDRQMRVWSYDIARGVSTPLTFDGQSRYPEWHPRGNRLLFSRLSKETDGRDIYEVAADGSGTPQLVFSAPGDQFEAVWLSDQRHLVVRQTSLKGDRDVFIVLAGSKDSVAPFLNTRADERAIAVSPDGRWLAYMSTESGQTEVYVRAIPGPGGKWQVSRGGGFEPAWSADGRELFYRDAQTLIAVSVQITPTFAINGSKPLFGDAALVRGADRTMYDVHPSGAWFVMAKGAASRFDIVLVTNWFDELRAKTKQ